MLHTCIKPNCGKQYESDEPDAYYCQECLKQKEIIAKQIDEKFKNRERKPVENFEQKIAGFKKVNGIPIINL